MTDGCQGASNITECNSVVNGLFSKGLHAAVQYFVVTANSILNARLNGALASMSIKVRVTCEAVTVHWHHSKPITLACQCT